VEKMQPWSFEEPDVRTKIHIKEGDVFGHLTVLRPAGRNKKCKFVECRCSCGVEKIFQLSSIYYGSTISCGHHRRSGHTIKHGHKRGVGRGTSTYSTWRSMKDRCLNPRNISYKHYGAKGIEICESWMDFSSFLSDMGERPNGATLDRIDNSKGYFKDNCRWATPFEQQCNRPDNRLLVFKGKEQALAQHCREQGIGQNAVRLRLKMGWDVERALTQPVQVKNRRSKK